MRNIVCQRSKGRMGSFAAHADGCSMGKNLPILLSIVLAVVCLLGNPVVLDAAQQTQASQWPEHIQIVLDSTKPLEYDRQERLPLYLWQAMDPGPLDDDTALELVKILDGRGVGLVTSWNPGNREKSLAQSMTIAAAQQQLGLPVNIDATRCLYSFFNGDPRTAHIDDEGEPFWDTSFGKKNMGCPFALDFRRPQIANQVEFFVHAFKVKDLNIDFIFADWEIDGPIEFNDAQAASKRCRRCQENIKDVNNFDEFQKTLRQLRCELQRQVYAEPVRACFPGVLVGNYGVYPHNGYRYWYDYYEYYVEGQPCLNDQRARYRKWYHEFGETGYTFAMPVVYTWERIFDWYDYADTDYRWFYNMLLVASNAGEHTPSGVPVISFVHWHTIEDQNVKSQTVQFGEEKYKELLWHMLLRGTDTFFLWCGKKEAAREIRLVHEVYAKAQQYGRFLSHGEPITFNVPRQPGTIISGLKLGDSVLVRRTDFTQTSGPVEITVGDGKIKVAAVQGCQIISLR